MKLKIFFILFLLPIYTLLAMPPHPDLGEDFPDRSRMPQLQRETYPLMNNKRSVQSNSRFFPSSGTRKVLVLVAGYADEPITTTNPVSFYETLFNGASADSLSWKKYYQDMSNNTLNLDIDVVFVSAQAPQNAHYYASNPGEFVAWAVNSADSEHADLDFSLYDNQVGAEKDGYVDGVVVIHAGQGSEYTGNTDTIDEDDIQSHQWDLNSAIGGSIQCDDVFINIYAICPEYYERNGVRHSTIGVFVHEFGHILGIPDLYDYSFETQGIGNWGVMAGGSWAGPNGLGAQPVPMHAWTRYQLGWLAFELIAPEKMLILGGLLGNRALDTLLTLIITGIIISLLVFRRKETLRSKYLLYLPVLLSSVIIFTACGDKGQLFKFALNDVESSDRAKVIELDDSEYVILENKVKTAYSWSEYLPSGGLLITHIDDSIILNNGWWLMNKYDLSSNLAMKIVEADGQYNLLQKDYNYYTGYRTDTFYKENVNFLKDYMTNEGLPAPFEISNVGSIGSTIDFEVYYPE